MDGSAADKKQLATSLIVIEFPAAATNDRTAMSAAAENWECGDGRGGRIFPLSDVEPAPPRVSPLPPNGASGRKKNATPKILAIQKQIW